MLSGNLDAKTNGFLFFVIRLLLIFALIYGICLFVISTSSSKGEFYISFIEKYFNIIAWLRSSLMAGTSFILDMLGYQTFYPNEFGIRNVEPTGRGIWIVYSCLGYGIMSFWIAFVCAHSIPLLSKIKWTLLGLVLIWFINIMRLSLVFLSVNSNFRFPIFDHHTWFNIMAYIYIFAMMFLFSKRNKPIQSSNDLHESQPG